VLSALVALALVTAAAWYSFAHGHDDFARGLIIGGVASVTAVVLSTLLGQRGPSFFRVLGGFADERERSMMHRAGAHGALGMMAAACAFAIAAPSISALVTSGVILWAGILATAASLLLQARRR
jgi:hypothetical protein